MGVLQKILWTQHATRTTSFGVLNPAICIVKRTLKKPASQTRLAEVGRLEPAKADSKYETGQLFLHKIFGYRGVVLFPWKARVYDRDLHNPNKQKTPAAAATQTTTNIPNAGGANVARGKTPGAADKVETAGASTKSPLEESSDPAKSPSAENTNTQTPSSNTADANESSTKEVKGKVQTFYQVLIDSRDCPYIRAQTEAVTFLGNQDSNRSLYAIPGLDYVSHDDIMPYSTTEKTPLQHELFEKFLGYAPDKDPPFEAKDTLKTWQEKNHPWLELSDVHKETTENIRVTVIPFYMGCRETPASSVYWWRYSIRLENLGMMTVQLRERHWRIFSLSGTLETVRGRGVVGQEPILSPRLPAFQYSSHVSLQAPSGHMWGTFRLEREDGHMFDCKIPPFSLESKPEEPTNANSGQTKNPEE
ncbi:polymerase delta-interacting protein 2 [Musca domestica]|uniref:Polymerase delta-interacting protein 2 n=1 Tax=Musca domestica TaxID=7370 RepID=T1PBT7_MUSDO|nr:polymerase delta-interacting protein 2 [Musca domestica]XP_005178081.2 polymerase delta-interacting protein 2 [Musca domestica]